MADGGLKIETSAQEAPEPEHNVEVEMDDIISPNKFRLSSTFLSSSVSHNRFFN